MTKAREDRPTPTPMLVRLDADLKAELDRLRAEDGVSSNFVVNRALREWIERHHVLRGLGRGKRAGGRGR